MCLHMVSCCRSHPAGSGWGPRSLGPGRLVPIPLASLPGVSVPLSSTFPLTSLLPGASSLLRYYRYSGSLTMPGCEPAVLWTVFEDAVPIGRAQVAQFQIVPQSGPPGTRPMPLTENFRQQQPLPGRRVWASPSASMRATAPPPSCLGVAGEPALGALLGLGLSLLLGQGP
ncbi:PREDICTED: carbonic anhydrase 15-like [Hipposideros armiger]|uniref:Carbonic anhydrase 15-like n=1 Tax=Hipposideros armiger TaxID=186990 RepID=A0A8B7QFQ4_HIPAR|nr:PREDICTED: carbonic anhydrase 15-like [Hipposideros armiger]